MTNYAAGHAAEQAAAQYLRDQGYMVRDMNWKTRYCEIDIIAEKQKVLFFTEVKSRNTANQGSGFDYITSKKLQQMTFAAEYWVAEHDWQGDYRLAALSIDAGVMTFVEID